MRRSAVVAAAFAAAVALFVALTVPPRRIALTADPSNLVVPGTLHVHTVRSDGRGTPEEIAAAAARAGLKFVVLTDHGDATRTPDPPIYRSGVLCLDGVEISTSGGHYVAIDMPASPYPLGGEPRDVVEDVRRLGGFGIVAHPDSPKPELAWRAWDVPYDGIELLNLDTAWRQSLQQAASDAPAPDRLRAARRLLTSLLDYPVRPSETMARLMVRTKPHEWAREILRRRVVAIAGADAHSKLGLRSNDPGDNRYSLPFPGYQASFETMSVRVRLDRPLAGDAASDARVVMRAIRAGHLFVATDAIAAPPYFELTASNELGTVHEGDTLGTGSRGFVTLRIRSNAPPDFTTVVFDGGSQVSGPHHQQDFSIGVSDRPSAYWVEITAPGARGEATWIRSNAVYVRGPEEARPLNRRRDAPVDQPADAQPAAGPSMPLAGSPGDWHVEHDGESKGEIEASADGAGQSVRLRYTLGGGGRVGRYVALVRNIPSGTNGFDRLAFTMRAERPMRLSVQLRTEDPGGPGGPGGIVQRWLRSVYVDVFPQERTVYFDELMPAGETRTRMPISANVRSILFGIDATNTKPGASGWFEVAAPVLESPR